MAIFSVSTILLVGWMDADSWMDIWVNEPRGRKGLILGNDYEKAEQET